jgi:hypothetical protein
MGKRTQALLFIIVNIIVSVAATLTVLWLWERAHPRPEVSVCYFRSAGSLQHNSKPGVEPLIEAEC